MHALRRIADLPNLPPAVLKTLDWTLRKDIQEIEKVRKLDIWKAGLTPSFVTGYAGAERAALMDVEQPSVGERSAQPEHSAAEHQRVGLGTQHATPVQPTYSAPVDPCGEADCSCSTEFSRAGKVQLGALPPSPVGRLARIPPFLWFIHLLHVLLAVNLICASCMHPSRCTPRRYST